MYELCAGLIDKGAKSQEQIAAEEIAEECGYQVRAAGPPGAGGLGVIGAGWVGQPPGAPWRASNQQSHTYRMPLLCAAECPARNCKHTAA